MMFGCWGKCIKAINTPSVAVSSKESVRGTLQDQQLPHNSCRHQGKSDAQAAEIATGRSDLDKTLEENLRLKNMLHLDQLVEAMTKMVSMITMKESPKISKRTQYKSVGGQR